jgi:hypothetical protein
MGVNCSKGLRVDPLVPNLVDSHTYRDKRQPAAMVDGWTPEKPLERVFHSDSWRGVRGGSWWLISMKCLKTIRHAPEATTAPTTQCAVVNAQCGSNDPSPKVPSTSPTPTPTPTTSDGGQLNPITKNPRRQLFFFFPSSTLFFNLHISNHNDGAIKFKRGKEQGLPSFSASFFFSFNIPLFFHELLRRAP